MGDHTAHKHNAVWFVIVAITVLMSILAANSINAEKAQAIGLPVVGDILPSPCELLPDGTATKICKGATDPVGTTGDLIGSIPGVPNPTQIVKDTAGAVANAIVAPILNQIAQAEGDAVIWILQTEGKVVTNSTSPDLTDVWFTKPYAIVYFFAVALATLIFILKMVDGIRQSGIRTLFGTVAAFAAFALIASILPAIVAAVIYVADKEITPAFISGTGASLNQTLSGLKVDFTKELSGTNNPVVPILVPLIALAVGVFGGIIALILLSVRYALLPFGTIAVLLGLALNVGLDWGVQALKKAVLWLLGWILFLPAIGFTLLIGSTMLANANSNILTSITAAVMLILAPGIAWMFTRYVAKHDIQLKPVDRTTSAIRNWKLVTSRR